jgi:hypothetical protein
MNRLEIGCRGRRAGWTTVDVEGNPSIKAPISPLPDQLRDTQWDVIELIHVFEHFYLWEARQFLKDAFDILAPSGRLIMEMPNIDYVARAFLGQIEGVGGQRNHGLWAMYGDPSKSDPAYGHKWGWSPQSLTEEMSKAGFTGIRIEAARSHIPARDFRIVGVKV